ncbi:hypothetical protein ABID82_007175 [Methylobacterium sp. PvP062]|uniref:Uncharacterized protein n=1 Tax=Methylobacterium radiotolerans TaxID=31998 RepID=A0ABV2NP58_9HYPH|nr:MULTISPECIES: hypothetical protein [unclassified Methylobacterium]MBP2494964.1 hypothetical protein [Methylobacterium sp. PvP105]MBP2505165.1 hypothetical protein [Methylobacterium sp. PvP109]MCX7336517.1 hypothetical protein [Hyphomicrobiales bacterium]
MPATTQSTTQSAPKRRRMTIEEALRWAIRDELPKRRADAPIRGPMPPAMHAMWRAGAFGGPIDNWSREPGMPPAMGDPHPDAITIEAHLQVLSETLQRAAAGSAVCPLDLSPYPMQVELRGRASLDVLISTAMHATPAWLVTSAIRGTRPDVGGRPECEPSKSENGKITLWHKVSKVAGFGPDGEPWHVTHEERTAPLRAGQYPTGTYCKLAWTREGVEVLEEQLRYAYWRAALVYLVPSLQFLTSIEVLPPRAPIAPWLGDVVEEIAPLPNTRAARRERLEDRLRPGVRSALAERRPAGRRAAPKRASEVRRIDPRDWTPPSERSA